MQEEGSGRSCVAHCLASRETGVLQAVSNLTVASKLLVIIASHVDDLLYTFDGPVGHGVISHIKQNMVLSTESECNFSFCGREVLQAVEDGNCSVHVACEARTRKSGRFASRDAAYTRGGRTSA